MVQADRTPTLEDLRARRAEILRIMARRGVRNIRVFGSVARGEAKPDSDIDLLVDLEPGRSALDLSELILDLEEALGRRVDVVELRRESGIAERIKRESVALWSETETGVTSITYSTLSISFTPELAWGAKSSCRTSMSRTRFSDDSRPLLRRRASSHRK